MECFAVDDRASFEALHKKLIPEARRYSQAPIVVIATKTDLRECKPSPPPKKEKDH